MENQYRKNMVALSGNYGYVLILNVNNSIRLNEMTLYRLV